MALLLFLALWRVGAWPWYWAWWAGFSASTLMAYGFDKWQSKRQSGQRIPELILHLLALSGGVAGAWIGMFAFRHKTRHVSFTVVLLLATLLHFALWYLVVPRA
ncbi:MAG TPA: DUF1294 domain-containing protein [Candidatus Saccharimonadales bacterium]|nr:DUF1294 domain-containing protein [Candidatus Saccharimonadales bacterium]